LDQKSGQIREFGFKISVTIMPFNVYLDWELRLLFLPTLD